MPSALPGPSLTWQQSLNNIQLASGTALTDHRTILLGIKNALIGFGTNPCAVKGSSNSTVAGLDGVDRWSAIASLVWANAASAHSWIVLEQGGIYTSGGSKTQILMSCEASDANGGVLTLVISPSAGFTGGSTTARPTATDEMVLLNGTSWLQPTSATSYRTVWNVQMSSDGRDIRVFAFYNLINIAWWHFAKLSDTETGVTIGANFAASGGTLTVNQATWLLLNQAISGKARPAGTTYSTSYSGMGSTSGDGQVMTAANVFSGKWPAWSIRISAGNSGYIGTVTDLYFVSTGRNNGDGIPGGGTKIWGVVGNVAVPTGGTALTTS